MEYHGKERRDAIAPLLRLGHVLVEIRRKGSSGLLELHAGGQEHSLEIARGTISLVRGPGLSASCSQRAGSVILRLARDLFLLERPLVEFKPLELGQGIGYVDPESVVLSGVLARREVFDPVALAERIPAEVLRLPFAQFQRMRHLPLSLEEREFMRSLSTPTPVTLALWKRGLHPQHAAALLIALNLLCAFEDRWACADLPRCGAVRRLKAVVESRRPDHEILDVDPEAQEPELDLAYRRIALRLHPDRSGELPEAERRDAAETLARISEAYSRLKSSRRSRRVREDATALGRVTLVRQAGHSWEPLVEQAQAAALAGSRERARTYALKAMSHNPPDHIKKWLIGILAA
ncbi:MAG: J domain-containing protein [Myxococcota bacterium]|nr:J domain-containing protein [Myxococcota bacterium]